MTKNIYFIILTLVSLTFAQQSCGKKSKIVNDDAIDFSTMATPNGSKLLAAAYGPVRAVKGIPAFNLNTYKLSVTGIVDSPYKLNWTEVRSLPAISTGDMMMYCVDGWEVWGNWRGILVKDLLSRAGLRDSSNYVLFKGLEGYTTSHSISYLEEYNCILAYEVNGDRLSNSHGYPLRLVAFSKFGYKWAKWVTELEVTYRSTLGFWENIRYSDEAHVELDRRKYYEGPSAEPLEYLNPF